MKKIKNKSYLFRLFFGCALVILGVGTHWENINKFPTGIHAWSQSDRYALALGFVDNGHDLFHPQTFILNKQFPGRFREPYDTAITSVDFPVHDYVVSLLMWYFNTRDPWCFRVYTLLYSFIGLFFLYKLAYLLLKNDWKASFVTLFMATSPIFTHYQASFIPGIPSWANVMIGYYFYFTYKQGDENNFKPLITGLFFLVLAALNRMPFAIFLIAVIVQETLYLLKHKKYFFEKTGFFLSAILVVMWYFIYNAVLRTHYGSVFLGSTLTPENWDEVKEILEAVISRWLFHYFTVYHYAYFGIIVLMGILAAFYFKINDVTIQFLIAITGCVAYAYLMLWQFPDHDYYFIDTFFSAVAITLIGFLSYEKWSKYWSLPLKGTLLSVFGLSVLVFGKIIMNERNAVLPWDRLAVTIENFEDSETYLDELGVPVDAKILVIDAYAPNVPLMKMNRKGYSVMTTSRQNIEKALTWDYDFVVIQDTFRASDVLNVFPELLTYLRPIAGNSKITLYERR